MNRMPDDSPNFEIHGICLGEQFHKYNYIKRLRQEIAYGRLMSQQVSIFKPDLVLASNNPLDAQDILWKTCEKLSIPTVFWLQDFWGIAIRKILAKKFAFLGALIGNRYIRLEKKLVNRSNKVVLITNDFMKILMEWGIPKDKMYVIPNWAPIMELPIFDKENDWSRSHLLDSQFVFLYSGTLGLKHRPELLVQLAQAYQSNPEVKIVVVSEGLGANWLQKEKQALGLDNLILMKFQPFSLMPQVLASADVLISILEPSASEYSVPSKVLTYLCAARPLLLYVPPTNLSAKIISDCRAGYVTDDPDGFLDAAKKLFADCDVRKQMGHNAREYAERTFDIERIGARFEDIFEQCFQGESKCKKEH